MSTRISTGQLFQNAQGRIAEAREKETVTAEKASSGKALLRPSQNPSGFMSAVTLKDELSRTESIARNANLADHVLSMTETMMSRLQEIVQRTHELALGASGHGTGNEDSRKFILGEVGSLYESALQVLNTRYANRSLLSGFKTDTPAFTPDGKFAGDLGKIEIEIAKGLKIPLNISADRAIMGHNLEKGVDILSTMRTLIDGLGTNNTDMIHSALDPLRAANGQISLVRGEIGSRQEQIKMATDSQASGRVDTLNEISKIEDADAVKVFSDLARDQTILRAAISTSQKILNENPSDMLFKG